MKKAKHITLTEGPVGQHLFRMTIPALFGIISIMMFNIVDTYFIAQLGTNELAAITFTFPVTFTLVSLAIGLGIGTSAVIAKVLGEGQLEKASRVCTDSLLLSFLLVIVFAILGYFSIHPLFTTLGAKPEQMQHITTYMSIWYLGVVFLVIPIVANAAMRASGDAFTPGIIMALSAILNGIFDPILIFGLGPIPAMGVAGAAWSTVIAWALSSVTAIYIVDQKKQLINKCMPPMAIIVESWKKVLTIALPAAASNMLTPICTAVVTYLVAQYGKQAVAAFGVGSRIESLSIIIVLALSMSLPPLLSQNYGAQNFLRIQTAIRQSLLFALVWQSCVYIALLLFAQPIATTFSDEPEVQQIICQFIWILPLSYAAQGVLILSSSSFNALHLPMQAARLSIIRLVVLYVPFCYIGSLMNGTTGLFVGAACANLTAGVVAFLLLRLNINRLMATAGSEL